MNLRSCWPVLFVALLAACGNSSSSKGHDPGGSGGSGGSGGAGETGGTGGTGGGSGGSGGIVGLPSTADHARMEAALRDLSALDMGGRLTGAPSGDRAEAFVRDFLETQGLEVLEQEVSLPVPLLAPPVALEVLNDDGAADAFDYLEEFREVQWAGTGDVRGELVFVGHGVVSGPVDAYAGLDVAGKIVGVTTGSPTLTGVDAATARRIDKKIAAAKAKGAVGVVFVPTGTYGTMDQQLGVESVVYGGPGYSFDPEVRAPDMPAAFVHVASTQRLFGQTSAQLATAAAFSTGKRIHLEVHADARMGTCRNLYGVIRGSGETADDVVILGAHYDHLGAGADGVVFPGASDNATGAAVVLEAASTLGRIAQPPRRTVVFALFCGEELGLWGSKAYVDDPPFPLDRTRLMIQVDYLGNQGPIVLTNYQPTGLVKTFVGDAAQHDTWPLKLIDYGGQCASDDCSFLAKDIPSYRFLAEGDHHHRVTDVYEHLSLPIVERVADICVTGIGAVAW